MKQLLKMYCDAGIVPDHFCTVAEVFEQFAQCADVEQIAPEEADPVFFGVAQKNVRQALQLQTQIWNGADCVFRALRFAKTARNKRYYADCRLLPQPYDFLYLIAEEHSRISFTNSNRVTLEFTLRLGQWPGACDYDGHRNQNFIYCLKEYDRVYGCGQVDG